MQEVKESDFQQEVISSSLPVVVDFWAEWCGPCKMIAPILEELSQQLGGKVKFVKVNVDENPNLTTEYGIMSIPTLIIFKEGKPLAKTVGTQSREELLKFIENNS